MKTKTVTVVLHNSKEYKALDKKLKGLLTTVAEDFKETDSAEVTDITDLIVI